MKRPLLMDLAYARAGTFMGVTNSSKPEYINVLMNPLNSTRTITIPDVPRYALQPVKTAHQVIPKEGVFYLLTGSGGLAPVMEELDLMKGRVFAQVSELIARYQQAEAKSAVLQKGMQQSVDEVVHQQTETLEKIHKLAPAPMVYGKRRPYQGSGQLMEG
jgi:hypothetical protein